MRSEREDRVLEAAIELFAESGYAASARDIAKRGRATTMTLYHGFLKGKESLFEAALDTVIARSFEPGKFVLFIYEDQKPQDFAAALRSGLLRWYKAIQPSSARLLAQAMIGDNEKWRGAANAALDRIATILATTIERQLPKKQKSPLDARTAAVAVIGLLFQSKWRWAAKGRAAKAEKEETREVEALLSYALKEVMQALQE